jgi:integrase
MLELESKELVLPDFSQCFGKKIDLLVKSKPYSEQCYINASNDLEAVQTWLDSFKSKENTYKVYERESVRFLLWCMHWLGKALGQLLKEDFEKYYDFISSMPSAWIMSGRKYAKYSSKWRPFSGPIISVGAKQTTIATINALMNYLVDAKYLSGNPAKLIKDPIGKINQELNDLKVQTKILEPDEWQMVQNAIENMPEISNFEIENKMRTKFLFALLYFTGLRRQELVTNPWCSFKQRHDQWWFYVVGKGNKLGKIPINNELLGHIKTYRKYLGKPELPTDMDADMLFVSKKTGKPIKAHTLYKQIKNIGQIAASKFSDDKLKQQRLLDMSPHWMRHLSASDQDKLQIPARHIRDNHRHSDIRTTYKHYVHSEDDERFNEIQKMSMELKAESLEERAEFTHIKLELKLAKGGAARGVAARKVLMFIENVIFKKYAWNYSNGNKDEALGVFDANVSNVLAIIYKLNITDIEQALFLKQAIVERSKAWLFEPTISIKGCKS